MQVPQVGPVTLDMLRRDAGNVAAAEAHWRASKAVRDADIRLAVNQGTEVNAVAEAAGLGRERVRQIVAAG